MISFCEKSHQNERSSVLCSLNVNKVSRIFSWFFFYSKFAFFGVIIKTPSSGQKCHEVNQSCTLPIKRIESKVQNSRSINQTGRNPVRNPSGSRSLKNCQFAAGSRQGYRDPLRVGLEEITFRRHRSTQIFQVFEFAFEHDISFQMLEFGHSDNLPW